MFDLFYVALAGLGFFIYSRVASEPSPQEKIESERVAIVPHPRQLYRPLNKLLLLERPRLSVVGKSNDQGWLGTPRFDVRDEATGTITPVYSTDLPKLLDMM